MEGGVTNGQDVVVRAYMKPISTLRRGLPSVDIDTRQEHRSAWERSDVTAVAACGVACEAMLAVVLADAMREKFGGDSLTEMRRNYDAYLAELARYGSECGRPARIRRAARPAVLRGTDDRARTPDRCGRDARTPLVHAGDQALRAPRVVAIAIAEVIDERALLDGDPIR